MSNASSLNLIAKIGQTRAGRVGLTGYYALTGKGGDFLAHKREYHRRRSQMEREFVTRHKGDTSMLRANTCPACRSSESARRLRNDVGFEFTVCARDGTVYMDPVPTEAALELLYNSEEESFLWLAAGERGAEHVRPSGEEDLKTLLAMGGKRGGRLLDVGCATGGFLLTARTAFDAEGIELNRSTAATARELGLRVQDGRLSDVAGEARFDVLTLLQVFEHIVAPEPLLADAHRLLAPGGHLYLNLPAVESASFALLGTKHVHVTSFAHVSLYSLEGLRLLAERSGFEVVQHEYCGGRDLALHDVLTLKLAPERFSHRMAAYVPRLYFATELVEMLLPSVAIEAVLPRGNASYQRTLWRKKG